MARGKKHSAEQIVSLLRQIEVAVANGKTTPVACRESGITEQTYYRWRKEYGGLQVDQARRLKELEQENSRLTICSALCFFPRAIPGSSHTSLSHPHWYNICRALHGVPGELVRWAVNTMGVALAGDALCVIRHS